MRAPDRRSGRSLATGSACTNEDAAELQAAAAEEFAYEIGLLSGGHNVTANLDSVYAQSRIDQRPGAHRQLSFRPNRFLRFRPALRAGHKRASRRIFQRVGRTACHLCSRGISACASAPQHFRTPSRTSSHRPMECPLSEVPAGPSRRNQSAAAARCLRRCESDNWQIAAGQAEPLLGSRAGDSMMWSDNIEPVHMVRLVNPEPFALPGFLAASRSGANRSVLWASRRASIRSPAVRLRTKDQCQAVPVAGARFRTTSMIGGEGGDPLTPENFIHSFVGVQTSPATDFRAGRQRIRNGLDVLCAQGAELHRPLRGCLRGRRHACRSRIRREIPGIPGIYITRFPGFRNSISISKECRPKQRGAVGRRNQGLFNYWNFDYRDGNTNDGNLIGNTVGREGRAIQAWFTYWISPRNTLQFIYKHSSVSADFIPGGGAWQDYSVRNESASAAAAFT